MCRMILISLVLLPVLAHAEASTSTERQQLPSSAALRTEQPQPAGLEEIAMAPVASVLAAPATAKSAASISAANTVNHAAVQELIEMRSSEDFTQAALRLGGTLEYVLKGSAATESSAPSVTRAVEMELSQQELARQPAVTHVVVRAMVDEYGIPRDLTIAQSAGTVVDRKALAAISQYRFKPATLDNKRIEAAVVITIKLQKQ